MAHNVHNEVTHQSPSVSDESISNFPTYDKLSESVDYGKEYEQLMCTLYALKLSISDDVIDFEMTTNNKKCGVFDDIELIVLFKNGIKRHYLLQLKHKKNEKCINKNDLTKERGPFYLKKYFDSLSQIQIEDAICILYTNSSTDIQNNETLQHINLIAAEKNTIEFEDLLLNTKTTARSPIVFQVKLENTSKQFYFFTQQNNIHAVKIILENLLKSIVNADIYKIVVHFIKEWWAGNFVLTRHEFITKVVEVALSPYITTLSANKLNDRSKQIAKFIMQFEITIVESDDGIVDNIWSIEKQSSKLKVAMKKFDITAKEASVLQTTKLLWHLNLVPLVIKVEDFAKVKPILQFLRRSVKNKRVVLIGKINKEDVAEWTLFTSLADLTMHDVSNIQKSFTVSLQGQKCITLEELVAIDEAMVTYIGTDELLKMSQDFLYIGSIRKAEDFYHIPRTVTTEFVKTSLFLDTYKYAKNCLVIINCNEAEKKKLKESSLEIVTLSEYLMDNDKDKYKNAVLVCTDQKCTSAQFEEVCKQSKMAQVYVLEIHDNDSCRVVMRKEANKLISMDSIKDVKQIKEDEIFQHFQFSLNVICAPPGMGKSRLLQSLRKNYCPSNLWVVYVELINHKTFFQAFFKKFPKDYETMLTYFLEIDDTRCDLLSKVKKAFARNKKLLLFLDGLDEVDYKFVPIVLSFAKNMSQAGATIWMTSRENLVSIISRQLSVIPIEIEEFTIEDRREYIDTRLKIKYEKDEIESIIASIFKSTEVSNSQQLLGIPLLLYIITETLLTNEKAYSNLINENTFIVTKLYKNFFNGKKKFLLEKLGMVEYEEQLGLNFDHDLKLYQIPALQICLNETDFQTLKIDEKKIKKVKPFLDQLDNSGDKYGIVKEIADKNQAVFVHHTFGEYFASVWFTNHKDKLFSLRESFFSNKYENLRLIFDVMMAEDNPLHLAVIYTNVEQVDTYMDCVETTDDGARTCLHLVCSHGMSCSTSCRRLNRQADAYVEIFQRLLRKCDTSAVDTLFQFSCVDYAVASRSLYPLENLIEKDIVASEKLVEILEKTTNFDCIAYYASQFGFPNLLRAIITKQPQIITKRFDNKSLLHVAVLGSLDDTYLPPRESNIAVIKLLAKNGLNLNSDLMEYVCQNGCYDMLEPLHTLGVNCKNGATILHKVAEYCDLNDSVMKTVKTLKIDIDARDDNGNTALQIACKRGHIENVKKLLDSGARTNIVDNKKKTALHYAVESMMKNNKIVDLLIKNGIDIDSCDQYGNTALHAACSAGWFEGVQNLLQHGANPKIVNIYNEIILLKAVTPEIINFLISHHNFEVNAEAQDKSTLLHRACKLDKIEVVKLLLDLGCDVNHVDDYGTSALHNAVEVEADIKLLELLLTSGTNINVQDEDGKTPLHFAIMYNYLDGVKTLIKHGANGNIVDKNKANILHYAAGAMNECTEILNELLDQNFDANLSDSTGKTPLHLACESGIFSHVKILLDHGAKVTVVDFDNTTPLHYAAKAVCQNEEMIEFLSTLGVDVDARNDEGQTAMHLACETGPTENVETLLNINASVNAVDEKCNNMLHYAAKNYNTEIISLMINKQIDVNSKNKHGTTPLQLACRNYNLEGVDLLLKSADVNWIDDDGMNALHYAAQSDKENTDVIKLLIKKGLDVNATDLKGRTPLHFACFNGKTDNMHILINRDAKVDAKDKNQMTILHYAASPDFENVSVLNFILTNLQFDANVCTSNGDTSLHLAVKSGNFMNVELLLNHTEASTSSGRSESILHYAVKSPNSKVLLEELLLNKEFDVNAYDFAGTTVLLAACQYSDCSTVKLLIDNGADVKSVDKFGHNALHYAVLAKIPDKELIKLLMHFDFKINVSYALKMDRYGAVKIFLEENLFEVEDYDFLVYAVYCGFTAGVRLIWNKIDVQNVDLQNDVYPLYFATRDGQLDCDLLLKMTAFINLLIEYFADEPTVTYSHKSLVMYLRRHFLSTFEGFHEVDDPYLFNRRCKHIKQFFQENSIGSI